MADEHEHEEVDLEQLAQIREERYQIRRATHLADPRLDSRLRDLYLDRTIMDTVEIADFMNYAKTSRGRVSVMRDGRARIVPTSVAASLGMRPGVLPGMDTSLGVVAGRHRPGTEKGRVIEQLVKDHRMLFNTRTGQLVPNLNIRVGRPRHNRPTLGPDFQQARAERLAERGVPDLVDPRRGPRRARKARKVNTDPAGPPEPTGQD